MAYLPPEPVTISGGCHCRAIRYKISIPALEHRPQIHGIPDTQILDTTEDGKRIKRKIPTAFPCVIIDHCGICRHVTGTPLQSWCVIPASWAEWTLESNRVEDESTTHLVGVQTIRGSGPVKPPSITLSSVEVCGQSPDGKDTIASTYISQYSSSAEATRIFCSRCGTHLLFKPTHYDINGEPVMNIAVGSLDDESLNRVHPERHMWWDSGIDWVKQLFRPDSQVCMKHPMGSPFALVDEEEDASTV